MTKARVIPAIISLIAIIAIVCAFAFYKREEKTDMAREVKESIKCKAVSLYGQSLEYSGEEDNYCVQTDGAYSYYSRKKDDVFVMLIFNESSEKSINVPDAKKIEFCENYIRKIKYDIDFSSITWDKTENELGSQVSLSIPVSDYMTEVAVFRFDNNNILVSANFNLDVLDFNENGVLTEKEIRKIADEYVKDYLAKLNSTVKKCKVKMTPNTVNGSVTMYVSYFPQGKYAFGGYAVNIDVKTGEVLGIDQYK